MELYSAEWEAQKRSLDEQHADLHREYDLMVTHAKPLSERLAHLDKMRALNAARIAHLKFSTVRSNA